MKFFTHLLALLVGAWLIVIAADYVPKSAVGVAVCGRITGVVIVYGSGRQESLTPDEATKKLKEIEKLPPEKRGLFSVTGPQCAPQRPQVY